MWETIIEHFQTLDQRPMERMAILVGGLMFFWVIEGAVPLVKLQYKKNKWRHALVNMGFTLMTLAIQMVLAIFIVKLSDWCKENEFGLAYWLNAGIGGTIILSVLILDFFGGWFVHFAQHKAVTLWRFHVVHHTDNNVDVTTGLRHHPIESILRGFFFFIAIVISGAPMYAVMIFQTLIAAFTAFTHANLSLPKWIDRAISYVFVSPNMHKVHHHWQQPYTDSNYGLVFSIWDRMFGTFLKLDPSQIRYGLDRYYPNEEDENFMMLMKAPFKAVGPSDSPGRGEIQAQGSLKEDTFTSA
jgi:sterol desaturase/sphingolipid hydroxylase (fatty acid hydroxylase superfamily)